MTAAVNYRALRVLAAVLITLSGIGQVAMLWFRDLTGIAVTGAFVGVVYIIIGLGLQGRSRFTLFMAIAVPAAAVLLNATTGGADSLHSIRLAIDIAVVLCCAMVLANTRS